MSGEISGMAVSSIRDAGSRATPDDTRRLHYQLRAPRDWTDTRWGESMPCCSPATFVSNLPTVVSSRGDQAARAEIELRVADLGYFRREQIREQTSWMMPPGRYENPKPALDLLLHHVGRQGLEPCPPD